jgi:hypothetical protein
LDEDQYAHPIDSRRNDPNEDHHNYSGYTSSQFFPFPSDPGTFFLTLEALSSRSFHTFPTRPFNEFHDICKREPREPQSSSQLTLPRSFYSHNDPPLHESGYGAFPANPGLQEFLYNYSSSDPQGVILYDRS